MKGRKGSFQGHYDRAGKERLQNLCHAGELKRGDHSMSVRTRLRALERQRRHGTLVTCMPCRHAFPPEQHPARLPPLEELRQLPYAELLRMYQEWNRFGNTPA